MSWRIDIFKDEAFMDTFGFKCKAKDHGLPKTVANQYLELIEELC